MSYLWVNAPDLQQMGTFGPWPSPIFLLLQKDLGEGPIEQGFYRKEELDQVYILIECTQTRAEIIKAALEALCRPRLRRLIRTRITDDLPKRGWESLPVDPLGTPRCGGLRAQASPA